MRYGIVVSDPSDWTAMSLLAAFTNIGARASFLNFSGLSAFIGGEASITSQGLDLRKLDGLVIRDLGRSTPQDVAFRFEVLRCLEDSGLKVVNPPEAIARAANKYATTAALSRSEVPTPETLVTSSLTDALEFFRRHGRVVFKPLFGYKGRGIELIGDEARMRALLESQGMVYLQEFISLRTPRDIRAFVVGDKVMGAIYRVARPGQWVSNLARGGKAEPCPVTGDLEDLAVRASKAVGAVYCGVDLLESPEGLKVIEVNGTPSGRGIFEALGIDVGKAIASLVTEHWHHNGYLRC